MTGKVLDLEAVLASLKDFQRDTAAYVFESLTDPASGHRFLVADEVGLGKTMVARGVIAQFIERLRDSARVDVVYVCANKDIASQNVRRLNTSGSEGLTLATRLTLLGRRSRNSQQADFRHNKINFISVTPGTSFNREGTRLGEQSERILLYHLLKHAWGLEGVAAKNVLQGLADADRFRARVDAFPSEYVIDEQILRSFSQALRNQPALKEKFSALCARFSRKRENIPGIDKEDRNEIVGELRSLLARVSLRVLSPDLVILDEFQRFRHLLDENTEAGALAHELFRFSEGESKAHVLLISATPYKMYTVSEDVAGGDDHYQDFLATTRFLMRDKESLASLAADLCAFRLELMRQAGQRSERLLELRNRIQSSLRAVMSRTERLGQKLDRNGMLVERIHRCELDARDLLHYTALQAVARIIEAPDVMEYWQSAPYLLNFMDDYELKRGLVRALRTPDRAAQLKSVFIRHRGLLLGRRALKQGRPIPIRNPRLKHLHQDMVESGAWQLLWTPPSLPCYGLEGPFSQLQSFTKRLIFSAWRVVPKAIASVLSYEAERLAKQALRDKLGAESFDRREAEQSGLLRFSKSGNRLTGMANFTLLYPSLFLSSECDPQKLAPSRDPRETSMNEMLEICEKAIARALKPWLDEAPEEGQRDEAWYWAAPLMLDEALAREQGIAGLDQWWQQSDTQLQKVWTGDERDEDDSESAWLEHIAQLRSFAQGQRDLGPPPRDLVPVLALTALASPANCAVRALRRITGRGALSASRLHAYAARMAWAFRLHVNRPHSITVVRAVAEGGAYWSTVLDYCAKGCLQSMLDEYVHVLKESLGLMQKEPFEVADGITATFVSALSLRPSNLKVDFPDEAKESGDIPSETMVSRFALQLAEGQDEAQPDGSRVEKVREAFNSPFWPFVVASTSIGQEGVDFHTYCHAIMHWNLPGNPVDMEQREGRIHRYKGHAVRKNLAARYAATVVSRTDDPWEQMFVAAVRERADGQNDLFPYWVFPLEGGARIERHVVAPPMSREEQRLIDTRRTLALYRMVFGQPRQDDLVQYLKEQSEGLSDEELESFAGELLIDLTPPKEERRKYEATRAVPGEYLGDVERAVG